MNYGKRLSFYICTRLGPAKIALFLFILINDIFCFAQNELIHPTESQEQDRPKIEVINVDPSHLSVKDLDLQTTHTSFTEKNSIDKNIEPENFYPTLKTTTPFIPYLLQIGGKSDPTKMIEILNFSNRSPASINEQSPAYIKPKIIIINPTVKHLPEKIKP